MFKGVYKYNKYFYFSLRILNEEKMVMLLYLVIVFLVYSILCENEKKLKCFFYELFYV
jgi:hypothetical protein